MKSILLSIIVMLTAFQLSAQLAKDSELFLTMKKHDSIFFDRCFNKCDFDYLEKAVHKDLLFYHAVAGIQNRSQFFESTRKNICSSAGFKLIRKVLPETLEVYPMFDNGRLYAVMQSGSHQFYKLTGKEETLTGNAKFTHLYLLENEKWILREVFSFDHRGY